MNKTYSFADITLNIEDPFEIDNYSVADPFLCNTDTYDFSFTYEMRSDISDILNGCSCIYQTDIYFIFSDQKHYYKAFHHNGNIYALTCMDDFNGICYYSDKAIMRYKIFHGLTSLFFIELERLFLRYQTCVLHCSHISWNNQGILFSAPSGTGKSTQADLWNRYAHAEIINGDRAAIRKQEFWKAYGLPMCGTSGISKNKSTTLAAIIVIRQHPENTIRKMSPPEAFRAIYSEVSVNRWNHDYVQEMINLILQLVSDIPVFLFQCTKEPDAVEALKNYLINKEVLHDEK